MRIELELNFVEDGRIFINFWNSINGDDVITQLIDNKLYQNGKEVSIKEFTAKVMTSFLKSV